MGKLKSSVLAVALATLTVAGLAFSQQGPPPIGPKPSSGSSTASDATLTTTDITTNDVSTSKHGFAPKAPNDVTKFLNGLGAYSVPGGAAITTYTPFLTTAVAASTGLVLTANRVMILAIEFPVPVSAGHIQHYWPTGDTNGAHNYAIGIYSGCATVGGTATLVANTAVIHPATATVISTAFAQGTVSFSAGSYCIAVTGDTTTAQFLVNGNVNYNPLAGTDSQGWNHPTATSAAGVFPATFTVPASGAFFSSVPHVVQLQP